MRLFIYFPILFLIFYSSAFPLSFSFFFLSFSFMYIFFLLIIVVVPSVSHFPLSCFFACSQLHTLPQKMGRMALTVDKLLAYKVNASHHSSRT